MKLSNSAAATRKRERRAKATFRRVVEAGKDATPASVARLKYLLQSRNLVPNLDERHELFAVAGDVGLILVIKDIFGDEYTTWLDKDHGDRTYGGPKIEVHEDTHAE